MIHVVVGPPAAGKSTFVVSSAVDGDVLVDYDKIAMALGAKTSHGASGSVRVVSLEARKASIDRILKGDIFADSWVIHTKPEASLVASYEKAGARFYVIDPGEETCLQRAKDEGRPDSYIETIRDWYADPPAIPDATRVESKMVRATKTNINAVAQRMVEAVRGFVARSERVLGERMDAMEARLAVIPAGEKGDKGDAGENGKDADPELILAEVEKAIALLPVPKDGKDGLVGERGSAGESIKGDPGKDGLVGDPGPQGEPGPRGEKGDSVTADDVLPTLEEMIREWWDQIPDPIDGKDGASIHPDTVALMVRDAVGKAVAALPAAKDGAPGRDAVELVPLPGIDESRSYPIGTWATYNGGEIRAARQTDPVQDGRILEAGWAVMREGIAALVVTQGEDPREFTVGSMLTSGAKALSQFRVPAVIDRGVWREEKYGKGDGVTWAGSWWIAQVDQPTDKPGISEQWRLAAKRGRDGKDGKDGLKGEKGDSGRNGKGF